MRKMLDREEDGTEARREAVQELIRKQRIGTQEELRELLAKLGFEVTQATLSRDLARLKARRVTLPEGGSVYELGDSLGVAESDELRELGDLVLEVAEGDAMIVIQTRIGAASAVALGVDRAKLHEILGTIAGDDTIFVAPRKGVRPSRLKQILEGKFGIIESDTVTRIRRRS